MAKESLSIQLVSSLEEYQGQSLQVAPRRAGFNGFSTNNGDIVRKIEIKTVDRSDNWFAINGLRGIESLFFDPLYCLYFVLIREKKIVVAQAIPFLQAQIPDYNPEIGDTLDKWLDLTRSICDKSGLNIIPRINFKLRVGIRELIDRLESGRYEASWEECVESIWSQSSPDQWELTFGRRQE